MRTVREIMTNTPLTLSRNATLAEAAQAMRANNIGDVLVTDDDGHLHGVITDRDIVVRAVAERRAPAGPVEDHVTTELHTVTDGDDTKRALRLMSDNALRRLPVLDGDGRLVGVVSLGDLAVCTQESDLTATLAAISSAPPNN
jgi:CBS domain-containing protein